MGQDGMEGTEKVRVAENEFKFTNVARMGASVCDFCGGMAFVGQYMGSTTGFSAKSKNEVLLQASATTSS